MRNFNIYPTKNNFKIPIFLTLTPALSFKSQCCPLTSRADALPQSLPLPLPVLLSVTPPPSHERYPQQPRTQDLHAMSVGLISPSLTFSLSLTPTTPIVNGKSCVPTSATPNPIPRADRFTRNAMAVRPNAVRVLWQSASWTACFP